MTGCLIALLTVSLSTGFLASAPESKLRWNDDYRDAKEAAQSLQRPMVVVLENPQNAGQRLDTDELGDVNLDCLHTKQYELCRVNVNTAYGKLVAEAFGAKQFPYTAVTDDVSKRIVFRKAGQMSELDWTHALARNTPQLLADDAPPKRHDTHTESGQSPGTMAPTTSQCFT